MAETSNTNSITNIDIIKITRQILDEVDSMRSYTKEDLSAEKEYTVPSESRLNTFFRLIGLPMFVNISNESDHTEDFAGDRFITPGFDKHFNFKLGDYTIQNSDQDNISTILSFREGLLKSAELNIGTPDTNKNMTLALTNPIPLHPNITNGGMPTSVGSNDSRRDVYKSLFPFVTSYLNVTPRDNLLARPFLPDNKRAMIGRNTLRKPFLETIARIRLSLGANTIPDNDKRQEFINVISNSVGEIFANELLKDLKQINILEALIINKLISSLESLAKRWVKIRIEQERLSRELPFVINVRSGSGRNTPLGKRMSVSTNVELRKDHYLGKSLDFTQRELARLEAIISLLPTDDTANPVPDGTSQSKNVNKSALINPFVSLFSNDVDYLRKEKVKYRKKLPKNKRKQTS